MPSARSDEAQLVAALRAGDEAAFEMLVERHHSALLRLALFFVRDSHVAQDVVQETWLAVLRGIDSFEGRSSLKTWIFSILSNIARTRAQREGRSLPFSAIWNPENDPDEPAVEPGRFIPAGQRSAGQWASLPLNWGELPEERLLSQETLDMVYRAIDLLPPSQREVIRLHDVEGLAAQEICNILDISESNQRVLLHRARARVRRALERHLSKA
ncbi:MAG: sigma-70 family RNA polymerase sigma factor [Anaerolineae bacterium]